MKNGEKEESVLWFGLQAFSFYVLGGISNPIIHIFYVPSKCLHSVIIILHDENFDET